MLAILTNLMSTTETHTLNFCPECKLITKNYGTGEMSSKILLNMSIYVGVQTITITK